jgi:hypothetical protein
MSNEPGYYEAGSFGIRIESIVAVKPVATRRAFGDNQWLGFERITAVSPSMPEFGSQADSASEEDTHSIVSGRLLTHESCRDSLAQGSQCFMLSKGCATRLRRQEGFEMAEEAMKLT